MTLRDVLRRLDEAVGPEGHASLRPPAAAGAIAAAATALGAPLPPALRELYEWHDGETSTSTLFDKALRADLEVQWGAFSEDPFVVSFMSLEEIGQAGVTELWLGEDGLALRSGTDAEDAEKTVAVPFVWIRTPSDDDSEPPGGDDDWLLAVDARRGAVWLFEVGKLEGAFEEAPSLSEWLDTLAANLRRARVDTAKPSKAPVVQTSAVLCLRFLVDRNLIEIAEGVSIAEVAEGIAPLLALKPPKRAVRSVLEHLSEDDAIAEVFADDDLLARVVSEFVD